jgi:hypothetical protein
MKTNQYIELHDPEGVILSSADFSDIFTNDTSKGWNPMVEDIRKAETILEQCTAKQYPNIYKKLSQYKRQYVGSINEYEDHFIGIYAFITSEDDISWKKGPIIIMDGGDNVFQTLVNLDKNTCSEIVINGAA